MVSNSLMASESCRNRRPPPDDVYTPFVMTSRLGRIHSKVDAVLPLVIAAVTRGAVLEVANFPRMMRDLAEIEALSRALRN